MERSPETIAAKRSELVSSLHESGLVTVAWRNLTDGTLSVAEPPLESGWCPVVVQKQANWKHLGPKPG